MTHEYYNKFLDYVYDTHRYGGAQGVRRTPTMCGWCTLCRSRSATRLTQSTHPCIFERFFLPDEYEGTPVDATHELEHQLAGICEQIRGIDEQIRTVLESPTRRNCGQRTGNWEPTQRTLMCEKLAACTKDKDHTFYILCGWMSETDAKAFRKELEQDDKTFCFVEEDHDNIISRPPTKLKNPGLFKPFEMFIRMYGLPSYEEIDPTIILGLTYSFLFGFVMFGDAGRACA